MKKWPDRQAVLSAFKNWAYHIAQPDIVRIGCIGSYARGDCGFGSDLDVVIILRSTEMPFESRSMAYDTTSLPVPVDCMVFTEEEIRNHPSDRFKKVLEEEAVWVWP
ncbi:MAG: nucleotidyltransferase domain-containing protein [Chitinivibrionales bacterium]